MGTIYVPFAHRPQITLEPGVEADCAEPTSKFLTSSRLLSDSGVGTSPGFTSLEHVLQWPMFHSAGGGGFKGSVFAANYLKTQSVTLANGDTAPAMCVPPLEGDEIAILLNNFLQLVHVMNPVMDESALLNYGIEFAELGPQWDTKTCLVVSSVPLPCLWQTIGGSPLTLQVCCRCFGRNRQPVQHHP